MTITQDGGRLYYAGSDASPRQEIFPRSETEFFVRASDLQLTFAKDQAGKVVAVIIHDYDLPDVALRLPDWKEAKVQPADCDALLGNYNYLQDGQILTVSREADHLYAQLTGQPRGELFPKSPAEFVWKVFNDQLEFVMDENGRVVKAIRRHGGQTIEAPKLTD